MKPFNLEEAKAGKPVCTRHGYKARILCFDMKSDYPIVAIVDVGGQELLIDCTLEGIYSIVDAPSDYDLFMAPEKRKGWINVYKSSSYKNGVITDAHIYENSVLAKKNACLDNNYINADYYIGTFPIEWEE